MTFYFATGIENSCPTLPGGQRVDQMETCGHYSRWEEDFALARDVGVQALRYGPAYYRTHVAPDRFDWSSADAPMRRLRELGLTVIADLCHFGVPDWLGGFQDPAFPVLFADYARAFTRRYPWVRHYTPVNEIFACASFSALYGWWNECLSSEPAFVRALRNLCMAHELAVEAILAERRDAVIVQSEFAQQFYPAGAAARAEADRWNALRYLALDLTLGRELPRGMAGFLHQHGVTSNDLSFFREKRATGQRWLGLTYYPTSERRVTCAGEHATPRRPLGFRRLATAYYRRYGVPLFHCATNQVTHQAVAWLDEQWAELVALRTTGVPVLGFTWYSLTDQVDWQRVVLDGDDALHPVGLYTLDRRLRGVGQAYRALTARWNAAGAWESITVRDTSARAG